MDLHSPDPRFSDYLRPLRSRKWLILTAIILATGGVYAYYARQPRVYSAGTPVFVKDPGDPVSGTPTPQSTDRNVSNLAAVMHSREVAAAVAQNIHYRGTNEELLQRVSLTSKAGEDFVDITAQGRTPREAAAIANAYAREFVTMVNNSQTTRVDRALALSKQQLAQLGRGPATQLARQNLGDQIRRLQLAQSVPSTAARQIDHALPPAKPSSPKPVRNALFALVLSLVAAIAAAYGAERFDRRLKRPDEVEEVYGRPLLAVLPHTDASPTASAAALGSDFREPFRMLRTNVQLARVDDPPRTLVVSSALPGEGKSTVVHNLALAFSEAGRRVAVVDADLRHSTMASRFGVPPARGLTDVLRHDATLGDVLLPVGAGLPRLNGLVPAAIGAPANGSRGDALLDDEAPATLNLLLAGAQPANPQGVLASDRLVAVLDELQATHDLVLIDSAPLLAVADTVPLLRYADAAVLVSRLGVTTRDTARRLAELVDRIPDLDVIGIVANDLARSEALGFGYGYGYESYGATAPRRSGRLARAFRIKQRA